MPWFKSGNKKLNELLRAAVEAGETQRVSELLSENADPDSCEKDNITPLMVAAKKGHFEIAEMLVNHGASVRPKDNNDMTALMFASEAGNTETVELLLERSADPNMTSGQGQTALMLAAWHGHTGIAKMLLDNKAKINTQDSDGDTALMLASWYGHLDIVKLLLEQDAKVNISDKKDFTALAKAANGNYPEIVKLLLEYDGKLRETGTINKTGSVIDEKDWAVLLTAGDLNQFSEKQTAKYLDSALVNAAGEGNLEAVSKLLRKGAGTEKEGKYKDQALLTASRNGNTDVAALLMDEGADKNIALFGASQRGHYDIVQLALDKGGDVNAEDGMNTTPLSYACGGGYPDIARLLLDRGANVNAVNKLNITPLYAAAASLTENVETAQLIADRGGSILNNSKAGEEPVRHFGFNLIKADHDERIRLWKMLLKLDNYTQFTKDEMIKFLAKAEGDASKEAEAKARFAAQMEKNGGHITIGGGYNKGADSPYGDYGLIRGDDYGKHSGPNY